MFDLDQAISEWRRQMAAGGIKLPDALDELESHLREEVGFENLVEQIEGNLGGGVLGAGTGEGAAGDSGVVDQDVEARELAVEPLEQPLHLYPV